MIGLDIKVRKFDLVLQNLRVASIFFKLGNIEQFCLKVNSLAVDQLHPCGMFLVLKMDNHSELLNAPIDVVLLSEKNNPIGSGKNEMITVQPIGLDLVEQKTPGFQLIDTIGSEVSIDHEKPGKPNISLGTLQLHIQIFDLRSTKECICNTSGSTSKNVSVDDVSVDISSSACSEDDGDDSSLENFLSRLKGRNASIQTHRERTSTPSQTLPVVLQEQPFKEKVMRARPTVSEVMAVLAPRNRSTTSEPAFFAAPPRRSVQLLARPSTVKNQEVRRKLSPPRRRSAPHINAKPRPKLWERGPPSAPRMEPRKTIAHNLPWY